MERTILVAEDSPTQAENLRLLLEGEGHRVDLVADGREGLERVRLTPPDLVISDVLMPEMDGYAFCREMKSAERTRRIPFVLLTERNTPADVIKGLQHGADNFITKPFEDDYLLERVRRIFENLELRRQGRLDVEITLSVGGQRITINADRQQMIELLFSTLDELVRVNGRLAEAQRIVEEHARDLEANVRERTRQLLQTQARFASILDATPEAVVAVDDARRIVLFSKGAEQAFGYTAGEAIGQPLDVLLPVRSREAHGEHLRAFAASPETSRLIGRRREVFGRRKDGSEFPAEASVSKVKENDQTIFTAVLRDITERKRTEEALRQSEKLAAMGELLAGVAHELNNPLSVVLGQSRLLQDRIEGPLAERVVSIGKAAQRCARIVKNFLALARQHPAEREVVALGQIVREAGELLAYQLRVDNVDVLLDLASDVPPLWADPHQIHQVLVNLMTNAHHAMREMPPPGRLSITTRFDPVRATVLLQVANTGPGIPPEIRARIFEPFFTTKPAGQGTGLGLSLCQGIIEGHGGTITVESGPGPGAVFRVELPVKPPPGATGDASVAAAPAPSGGQTILVVDDEAEIAELLAEILTEDGHRVEVAPNGAVALEKLLTGPYDLIVSDLKMPELDGPGLYRKLQALAYPLLSRFAFITGDVLGEETRQFLEETGALCIGKPFSRDDVRRVVAAALVRG